MQQLIQDRILLSIYPGCSIEEARERELKLKGCIYKYYHTNQHIFGVGPSVFEVQYNGVLSRGGGIHSIIGLPPSLPRVLHCLGNRKYCFFGRYIAEIDEGDNDIGSTWGLGDYICDRKLLNEDGTDATLRDQSEETQKAIGILLGWKDE